MLFVIGLVIGFSLLWLWAGYALLTNKRAARPLTIAISSGLTVLGIGMSLALLSEMSASVLWLLLLALGIYGFVVARRIQPPPHNGAQVNR